MEEAGLAPASILLTDLVVRNAYASLITCQHAKTPIDEIDEAIVSSLASILFDYMQRLHPKTARANAVGHLKLIFEDIQERLAHQIAETYEPPQPPQGKFKLVKH